MSDRVKDTYYAVMNDLIGGYDVSLYDKPVGDHDNDEYTIGSFMNHEDAQRIADALNMMETWGDTQLYRLSPDRLIRQQEFDAMIHNEQIVRVWPQDCV